MLSCLGALRSLPWPQALGRTQEDFLAAAQNKRNDANEAALKAAWLAFQADLAADGLLFDALLLRHTQANEKKRGALVKKLEEMWHN